MIALSNQLNEIGLMIAAAMERLIQMSWQGSLLIVAVALVTAAWLRGPACFKYGLWCLVLIKLLMPISISLPSGAVNVLPEPPIGSGHQGFTVIDTQIADAAPGFEWPLMSWVGLAWLVGACVVLLMSIRRYRLARELLARSSGEPMADLARLMDVLSVKVGLRRPVPVRMTHAVGGPLVIGLVRPTVYIPEDLVAGLERDEQATLLAHELAHVKRRDTLVAAVEMVALAVHWFNPLAWLMVRAMRTQRELACDDRVVALFADRAEDYGSGLLKVARYQQGLSQSAFGMAALGEGGSAIGARVKNILNRRRRPIAFISIPALIALAAVACVVLPNHARTEQKSVAGSETVLDTTRSSKDVSPGEIGKFVFAAKPEDYDRMHSLVQGFIEAETRKNPGIPFVITGADKSKGTINVTSTIENLERIQKYVEKELIHAKVENIDGSVAKTPEFDRDFQIDNMQFGQLDARDGRVMMSGQVRIVSKIGVFTADSAEYLKAEKKLILRGNAVATQTTPEKKSVLKSDVITVDFSNPAMSALSAKWAAGSRAPVYQEFPKQSVAPKKSKVATDIPGDLNMKIHSKNVDKRPDGRFWITGPLRIEMDHLVVTAERNAEYKPDQKKLYLYGNAVATQTLPEKTVVLKADIIVVDTSDPEQPSLSAQRSPGSDQKPICTEIPRK